MNDPKYKLGQIVDARDDRGAWLCGGEVIGIEASYAYRIKWPPMPWFEMGGEIIGSRSYEYGSHEMRAALDAGKEE